MAGDPRDAERSREADELFVRFSPMCATGESLDLLDKHADVVRHFLKGIAERSLQRCELELERSKFLARRAIAQWYFHGNSRQLEHELQQLCISRFKRVMELDVDTINLDSLIETLNREIEAMTGSITQRRTVASVDMIGYSRIAKVLEEIAGSQAVQCLNETIQQFIDRGLEAAEVPRDQTVIQTTGDGAILLFEPGDGIHRFAKATHEAMAVYNATKSEELAKRWFRIGGATGDVAIKSMDGGFSFAGIVIANAVRLETAGSPAALLIDTGTFDELSPELKVHYQEEREVPGKVHDKPFRARQCVFIEGLETEIRQGPVPKPQKAEGNQRQILELFDKLKPPEQLDTLTNLIEMPVDFEPAKTLNWAERRDAIVRWSRGTGLMARLQSELQYLIDRQDR